jgi:hypothetical protein
MLDAFHGSSAGARFSAGEKPLGFARRDSKSSFSALLRRRLQSFETQEDSADPGKILNSATH